MRMEEISEQRYFKTPDSVERYLLGVVEEYFRNSSVASTTSKEYVIEKAVTRMKEEVDFDGLGVMSVTLSDGVKRTGDITITLEDLGGEPKIEPKNSAFNVSFGKKEGTACEGNDSRLSDKREPTAHIHNISDIQGLEGELSTLTGKIERVGGLAHSHSNKTILDKLTYTGTNTSIDLTVLDTLGDEVQALADTIRTEITNYRAGIDTDIASVQNSIDNVLTKLNEFKEYVDSQSITNLATAKEYTNQQIAEINTEFTAATENLALKTDLTDILNLAKESYSLVGTAVYRMDEIVAIVDTGTTNYVSYDLPSDLTNKITTRGTTTRDCIYDIKIQWYTSDGKKIYYPLPYIVLSDDIVRGSINASYYPDISKIRVEVTCPNEYLTPDLISGNVLVDVYSKTINITV